MHGSVTTNAMISPFGLRYDGGVSLRQQPDAIPVAKPDKNSIFSRANYG
jgi:hypothetical protein